jgi:hypothetical protein
MPGEFAAGGRLDHPYGVGEGVSKTLTAGYR